MSTQEPVSLSKGERVANIPVEPIRYIRSTAPISPNQPQAPKTPAQLLADTREIIKNASSTHPPVDISDFLNPKKAA